MANEKILVVDDDQSCREIIAYNLADEGYDVTKVDSGESALAILAHGHYDFLFTDYYMSGMSGLELIAQVRERYPDMHDMVIALSTAQSNLLEEEREKLSKLGVDGYFPKPFDRTSLITNVKLLLESRGKKVQ